MANSSVNNRIWLILKIIFFAILIFCLSYGYYLTKNSKYASEKLPIQYIENWTVIDSEGNSFETGRSYKDDRAYTEDFTIIAKLPDNIQPNQVLCFQNRSNLKVYINGELRKSFDRIADTGIPGGSLKEFYITIPVDSHDSGAELKMIRSKTDWNPYIVFETFLTSSEGVYEYMITRYGVSFTFTIVLLAASILIILGSLILQIINHQRIYMIYGALGIFNFACWLLAVSQFTPFVFGLYYIDGLMGFFFCMMMPFSLMIYINQIQKRRFNKLYTVLFCVGIVNFILWTCLHFTGIMSFQDSLTYINTVLGIIIVCVIFTLVLDMINKRISDYRYTSIGFLIFMIMCIVEILKILITQKDFNQMSIIFGSISILVLVVIQQIYDLMQVKSSLEQTITKKSIENEQLLTHIVQTLAETIDAKDTYTKGHSTRVAAYSKEIARRCGFSIAYQNDIYIIALLHDIGKIGIPDAVINKPGKLTDEEYDMIKNHTVIGANILMNIKEKKALYLGAKWHHERYDGKGYPDSISGEAIPEQARIIAVADAYDAMTSYRSYRDPLPQKEVIKEIENGIGTQFDSRFAEVMLEMIKEDKDYNLREKK